MNSRALAERAFEARVEDELLSRGWVRAQGTFNPEICIDAGEMYRFIGATQIDSWERLIELYGDQPTVQRRFAQRVAAEIDARGVLDVLRQRVRDRGDYENLPLDEDINAYLTREALPHVPDAWIDHAKTKVGYEIPFTRHFYLYAPPRPLAEIDAELRDLEAQIQELLAEVTG